MLRVIGFLRLYETRRILGLVSLLVSDNFGNLITCPLIKPSNFSLKTNATLTESWKSAVIILV